MSRYNCTHKNGNAVNYGFDHAVGYFYQEWSSGNDDEPLVDTDSMFGGLTGVRLGVMLRDTNASENHIQNAFLDLAF